MPAITYIDVNGASHTYEVRDGQSVMQGGVQNDVAGIQAECGGAAACATCRVYVDKDWIGRIPPRKPIEESMLDDEDPRYEYLRLSCQIAVDSSLDGLVVRVAE